MVDELRVDQARAFRITEDEAITPLGLCQELVELHAVVDDGHHDRLQEPIVGGVAGAPRESTGAEPNRPRPGGVDLANMLLMARERELSELADQSVRTLSRIVLVIITINRGPLEALAHELHALGFGEVTGRGLGPACVHPDRLDMGTHSPSGQALVELIAVAGERSHFRAFLGDDFANDLDRVIVAGHPLRPFEKIEQHVEAGDGDQMLQGVIDRHVRGQDRQPVFADLIEARVGRLRQIARLPRVVRPLRRALHRASEPVHRGIAVEQALGQQIAQLGAALGPREHHVE
ncbi:hypothetical protein D3C87_1172080 [compost metagenome]